MFSRSVRRADWPAREPHAPIPSKASFALLACSPPVVWLVYATSTRCLESGETRSSGVRMPLKLSGSAADV